MHPSSAAATPPLSAAGDDDFDDEDDDDDMDVYDDDDAPSSSAAAAKPLAAADPSSSPSSTDDDNPLLPSNGATPSALAAAAAPDAKRPRAGEEEARRSFSSIEERRLFQRLWTDEDEIVILQGFYEFTSQRGTTHHAHQHDTGPFYEQIKRRLQLDFSKNQLVEKIRRLKKKFRNVVARMASARDFAFKSPHEKSLYDIASKIWSAGSAAKKGFDPDDDDLDVAEPHHALDLMRGRRGVKRPFIAAADSVPIPVEIKALPAIPVTVNPPPMPIPITPKAEDPPGNNSAIEDTVRSCFSPLVKDLVQYIVGIAGNCGGSPNGSPMMNAGLVPLALSGSLAGLGAKDAVMDERWRKQQILELEVYSKRLDLVQELIKVKLDELRSLG